MRLPAVDVNVGLIYLPTLYPATVVLTMSLSAVSLAVMSLTVSITVIDLVDLLIIDLSAKDCAVVGLFAMDLVVNLNVVVKKKY